MLPLLHTSGSEPRESRNRLERVLEHTGKELLAAAVMSGAVERRGPAGPGCRRSLEGAAASGRLRVLVCAEGSRHQGEPKAAASSLAGPAAESVGSTEGKHEVV